MTLFGSVEIASLVGMSARTPSLDSITESYSKLTIRYGWCRRPKVLHPMMMETMIPVIQAAVEVAMILTTPPLTLRDLISIHKPMIGMMNFLMAWRGSPPFCMDVISPFRTFIHYALQMSSIMTSPGTGVSVRIQLTRWSMWFLLPHSQSSTIAGHLLWRQWPTGLTKSIKNWPSFRLNIINMKPTIMTRNSSTE